MSGSIASLDNTIGLDNSFPSRTYGPAARGSWSLKAMATNATMTGPAGERQRV